MVYKDWGDREKREWEIECKRDTQSYAVIERRKIKNTFSPFGRFQKEFKGRAFDVFL